MATVRGSSALIPVSNLESFFHSALHDAAENQKLDADDAIIAYLTNLLSDYARSERLYDHTEDGILRRPLVELYRQAAEAGSGSERELILQRLGDVALFVSGILPHSLQRGLVGVDYYVSMGASAYGYLSDVTGVGSRVRSLRSVFGQLSTRFVDFMDLLAETVERDGAARHFDLMHLHDLWGRTGSRRLHRKLLDFGITPLRSPAVH